MGHFVYIIYSETKDIYYKGYSTIRVKRLDEHNQGINRCTSDKGDWALVLLQEYATKREILIHERSFKKANREYILWSIEQPFNLVKKKN